MFLSILGIEIINHKRDEKVMSWDPTHLGRTVVLPADQVIELTLPPRESRMDLIL